MKKVVPKKFAKFTVKHLCQSLIYKKVADLRHAILSKKRLRYRWFPENFVEFFGLFFYGTPPRDCFGISMLMKKIQIEMLFSMQLFIMCYPQIDYRLLEYLNHPFSLSLLTPPNLNISFYVIFNLFCCDVIIKFTLRSKKLMLEVRGQQYH